jgi:hypothetical protein
VRGLICVCAVLRVGSGPNDGLILRPRSSTGSVWIKKPTNPPSSTWAIEPPIDIVFCKN